VLLFCEAKRRDGGTEALLVLDTPNWCGTSVEMTENGVQCTPYQNWWGKPHPTAGNDSDEYPISSKECRMMKEK